MFFDCSFNEKRDISPVVEGLALDLASALDSGVVVDTGTIGQFNDIESPSNVWKRVSDTFEALEVMKAINSHGRNSNANPNSGKNNGNSNVNANQSTSGETE